MAGFKKKLAILAVVGILLAVSFPFLRKKYKKHLKPHIDVAARVCNTVANFSVLGYHIPWKYILPFLGFIAVIQIWRRRRRKRKEAEELAQRKFMTEAEAQKHLSELNKRLDTTERTMHLVMKQMEAVTKCLAKTLADDPALSEDKTLAEMTQGLVNLKESNV